MVDQQTITFRKYIQRIELYMVQIINNSMWNYEKYIDLYTKYLIKLCKCIVI